MDRRIKTYPNFEVMATTLSNNGALTIFTGYLLAGFTPVFWRMLNILTSSYILVSRIFWSMAFCAFPDYDFAG